MAVLDLTDPTVVGTGTVSGAIFTANSSGAGTGNFDPFLALKTGAAGLEKGWNNDRNGGAMEFDEDPSKTESITLSDIPITIVDGVAYYRFDLDVNDAGSNLTIDEIEIYLSTSADPGNYNTWTSPAQALVYELDAGGADNSIILNSGLSSGSGTSDMTMLVPVSDFDLNGNGTLDEELGLNLLFYTEFSDVEGGFEEWSTVELTGGTSTISGFKFEDTDGDGILDAGEVGMEGVTIYIDSNDNNQLDITELSTVTDADGNYQFANIIPGGDLTIREITPDGYVQTTQQTGVDETSGDVVVSPIAGQNVQAADIGNFLPIRSLQIVKTASVPGGTADTDGEIISYTLTVTNTGNAAIANVVVDDPFTSDEAPVLAGGFNTGDTNTDGLLDVDESWNYTASHAVTQTELDAGGTIDNTATVTGDDATGDDDSASVDVAQDKSLQIVKTASVPGGTADTDGEIISYTLTVTNTGNAAIANVVVDDPFTSDEAPVLAGGFNTGDTNTDGLLDVDESWNYTASHAVTQTELDAGGTIDNTATVTGDDATGDDDSASVDVAQDKSLQIVKTASVPGGTADTDGEIISYTLTVTNTGNAAIANVVVDDPFTSDEAPVLAGGFNTGDTNTDGLLDVDESWNYTASHAVTQAELDAGGTIDNTATVTGDDATGDDDSASVDVAQIRSLQIVKTASVPGGTADTDGEIISYTLTVTNTGNAAIANVVVDDPFTSDEAPVLAGGFNTGDTNTDGLLDVDESWNYTASHAVTQTELDAGGTIDNTATVTGDDATGDDDSASVDVVVPIDPVGFANTPGFWKNHPDILEQEVGFDPATIEYEDIFMIGEVVDGGKKNSDDPSLLEALGARGGHEAAFLRATSAAYANTAANETNYVIDEAQLAPKFDFDGSGIIDNEVETAALQDLLDTLSGIAGEDDEIDTAELIDAVQSVYVSGEYDESLGDPIADALDCMNNYEHVGANDFLF